MKGALDRTGYMTLRQAAEWLGMGGDRAAGLRLKRLLEAKEREGGRQILIRRGAGPGSRLLVTRALLRAHVPEIWSPEEAVVELVRERLGAIEGELERGRIERRVLGRKIARMTAELARVQGRAG